MERGSSKWRGDIWSSAFYGMWKLDRPFGVVKQKMKVEVLIGRRERIDAGAEKLMRTEIKVGPNYPNPFSAGGGSTYGGNPQEIIPNELQNGVAVIVAVYIGSTLVLEAGLHALRLHWCSSP